MSSDRDWRALYPFESREILVGGQRIHYLDEGTGPTLLMVHGNPTWSFAWRNVILGLRDRFRCVAVDHVGCGLSAKPSAAEYPYRLARRIADLNEFIEKLDLRAIALAAHDWGGAIGLGAAVAAPERFDRFALMNTAAFRMPTCPWPTSMKLGDLPVGVPEQASREGGSLLSVSGRRDDARSRNAKKR